jgi:hypothetical protein
MKVVAKMFRNHLEGIVAWARIRMINGFFEALNGLLQTAKRKPGATDGCPQSVLSSTVDRNSAGSPSTGYIELLADSMIRNDSHIRIGPFRTIHADRLKS